MMKKWMKKCLLPGLLGICIWGLCGCGSKEESYRIIEVMQMEGTVRVTRESAGELEAYENMRLESGDQIQVEANSSAVLSLDDDKYVLLEPKTQISLEASGTSANSRTVIRLQEGAVVSQLTQKLSEDSSYEVSTPNSTMAVRGTVFRVEVVYDADGNSYTYVTVLEGSVASRLIFPDGTEETVEEERLLEAGAQVNIRGDAAISEYYPYDAMEIDFDRYTVEAMDFLGMCLEREAKLCLTREEIDEWTKILSGEAEEEAEPQEEIAGEEEEADEEETEETAVQTPARTPAAAEAAETQTETPQPAAPAEEDGGSSGSSGGSSSSGSSNSSGNSGSSGDSSDSDSSSSSSTETYTVTFTYQGNTFYTLTVEKGAKAAAPILRPTAEGHWNYDASAAVTGNMTVPWVEE